ncbi:hypothetical protein D1872_223390 [compost metagenome]
MFIVFNITYEHCDITPAVSFISHKRKNALGHSFYFSAPIGSGGNPNRICGIRIRTYRTPIIMRLKMGQRRVVSEPGYRSSPGEYDGSIYTNAALLCQFHKYPICHG